MSLLLLLLGAALAAPSELPMSTWARTKASRSDAPTLPDTDRLLALTDLVADLLRGAPAGKLPPEAQARAAALGLVLEHHEDVLWLVEPPSGEAGVLRGDGMVAIRLGALPAELVLQAPHPFYDRHTGRLTGDLFDRGEVRAAMLASAQRFAGEHTDPTHDVRVPLQAATEAVAASLPDALVVQLHGFGDDSAAAAAVLSAGMARSGGDTWDRAVPALARGLGIERVLGPDEVPLLAALSNVQARLLADRVRFLHVELDSTTRDRLRADDDLRAGLHRTLLDLAARRAGP